MCVRYYNGDNIYFRPIELDDADLLVQWLNDPENWQSLGRSSPINRLREKDWIEKLYQSPSDLCLGIAMAESDALIGCVGFHNITLQGRSAVFGIFIGDLSKQGIGLGGEAVRLAVKYGFEELNLNRIELSVFANNERGIRAYRRAGFVQEGRQRQAYYRNGRYHDVLLCAILREDWDSQQEDDTTAQGRLASMTH